MKNVVESLYLINTLGNVMHREGMEGIKKEEHWQTLRSLKINRGSTTTISVGGGLTVLGKQELIASDPMGGINFNVFDTKVLNSQGEKLASFSIYRPISRGYEFDESFSISNRLNAYIDARPTLKETARLYFRVSKNLSNEDIRLINAKARELLKASKEQIKQSKIRNKTNPALNSYYKSNNHETL